MIETYWIDKILGSVAALLSAGAWAFSTILFRKLGNEVSPIGMNLGKCIIGILYIGIILLIFGIKPIDNRTFLLLGFSGLLGIAFGDTFYFKVLIYLGPRLTILLGTLGPVFTIILALIFLKERPSLLAWIGTFFTITGIIWVLWEQVPKENIKKKWFFGIVFALLSVICMSTGIILSKIGLINCPPLQATFIRIIWSAIGLTIWGSASGQLKNWLIPFINLRLLKLILFTVFVAIFGGFYLFLFALRYIDASIATILNSTTPLFILPMTAFIFKEKITFKAITGATLTVIGITLIFLR
jgi:drug/metabolite transporter (DMT)-like permease